MVAKLTGTLSEMLHREGNIWEPLNTHHFPGMKYVDPDLITHIIKSAQQFCGRARQSRVAHRQPQVKLMLRRNVICFIHLSDESLCCAYKLFFIRESYSQNLISLRQMYLVIAAFVTKGPFLQLFTCGYFIKCINMLRFCKQKLCTDTCCAVHYRQNICVTAKSS